jgi:hypothetical protein
MQVLVIKIHQTHNGQDSSFQFGLQTTRARLMGNETSIVHLDSRVKLDPATCCKNPSGTWKAGVVPQREPRTGPRRAGTGGEWAEEWRG